MEFKRATLEDIDLIQSLADVIFRNTYKNIISAAQMDYMFGWMYSKESLAEQIQGGHTFFIASVKDEVCGFFSVELKDAEQGIYHLQKLYLLPQYHGKGAGEKLINGVFEYIKSQSPTKALMNLNVNRHNKRAIAFYEKIGLIKTKSVDVKISEDFYMNDYLMSIAFESI